jgi:hypothetical protein
MALVGVVALLGTLVVSVPTAYACPKDATNCQESGDFSTPGNGTAAERPDLVPEKSTKGTVYAAPFSPEELAGFDSNWATIVNVYPKLGGIKNTFVQRVLTCAVMAPQASDAFGSFSKQVNASATAQATDTSQLFLTLCLQMVFETQKAMGSHIAHAASAGCGLAVESIPIQVKRTGSTYTAQVKATPRKAGKTPLKVSCRAKGSGIQVTLRPRAKRRKLHQVITQMGIGFSNPTSRPVKIHAVFGFSG